MRLAAAVGVSTAALDGVPVRWDDWAAIGALRRSCLEEWRSAALIGRPKLVHALREYDVTDIALQSEVAKRWPQFHVTPGYAWDKSGLRQDTLDDTLRDTLHDNELGVSFELPIFNRHEGPIGEALARRKLAGEHLQAVQAELFEEIERAEHAWPQAERAWRETDGAARLARQQHASVERAFAAGATDRSTLLAARLAATEAELITLKRPTTRSSPLPRWKTPIAGRSQGEELPLSASLGGKALYEAFAPAAAPCLHGSPAGAGSRRHRR